MSGRCAAALLLAAAVAAFSALAGPPVPPAPDRFVTDKAGVLKPETVRMLEGRLRDFEEKTSNQLLVYLEPKIPEGTTLEEYTVAAAQTWRAGQKERKNGLVLFVFPLSRAARFEVGYGLEGALPDALAGRILALEVLPRFRGGDFDGGVRAGVESAIAATKGEYRGTGRRPRERGRKEGFPWGLVLFLLVFFVFPMLFGGRRGRYWYLGGGGFGSGGFGGFGGFGGGGGGFSGGGGSFGGGGASGRW